MKPGPFDYVRPQTLQEALALLAEGEDLKPIAGGQSLIPLLVLRMANPRGLVDIARLSELQGIAVENEMIRIGALTRWRDVLCNPDLARHHPLLVEAIKHTAHYQIRNRGTVGGSCCHADPAAEMPAVAVTCDAEMELVSIRGSRRVPAAGFFLGILTTAIEPDEILAAIHLPVFKPERRFGFQELARRKGDFALVGCAVFWDELDGVCDKPHVGVFGVSDTAQRMAAVESVLAGRKMTDAVVLEAVRVIEQSISPQTDLHATAEYRTALLGVLFERALRAAASQDVGSSR